jgi:hypothetical protein
MSVVPDQFKIGSRQRPFDRDGRIAAPDREPELRIDDTGFDLVVSMHVNAGIQPQKDWDLRLELGRQVGQSCKFIMVIDGNQTDTGGDRLPQLLLALVVPVKRDRRRANARAQSSVELPARDHVESQPFLVENADDGDREQRLACVPHPGSRIDTSEGVPDPARPAP